MRRYLLLFTFRYFFYSIFIGAGLELFLARTEWVMLPTVLVLLALASWVGHLILTLPTAAWQAKTSAVHTAQAVAGKVRRSTTNYAKFPCMQQVLAYVRQNGGYRRARIDASGIDVDGRKFPLGTNGAPFPDFCWAADYLMSQTPGSYRYVLKPVLSFTGGGDPRFYNNSGGGLNVSYDDPARILIGYDVLYSD